MMNKYVGWISESSNASIFPIGGCPGAPGKRFIYPPYILRPIPIVITVSALLFTTIAFASPPASIDMTRGNPALKMFNPAITFYATFDGHSKADLSCGKGRPIGNRNKLSWGKGMWGQALYGRSRNLIY